MAVDALVEEYGAWEVAISLDPDIMNRTKGEQHASLDRMYHVEQG